MKYSEIVYQVSRIVKLSKKDIDKLAKNRHFKLLTMMPFLIGSNDPERYAASILTILLSALKLNYYKPKESDFETIFALDRRLNPVFRLHDNGNVDKLAKIKILVNLVMLSDMKKDKGKDRAIKKYNPFNTDKADMFEALMQDFIHSGNDYPDIAEILTTEIAAESWWW